MQDLAWEFEIMGLTGDGARALFDLTHILPADAALLEELQSQPDEYFGGQKTFELWDEIAHDAPKVFFGTGFTEAQAILGNHLQQILNGEKSAEDGMQARRRRRCAPSSARAKGRPGMALALPALARRETARPVDRWWRRVAPYAFISPFYLIFLAFGLLPIVFSLAVSLYDWRGIDAGQLRRRGELPVAVARSGLLQGAREHGHRLGSGPSRR